MWYFKFLSSDATWRNWDKIYTDSQNKITEVKVIDMLENKEWFITNKVNQKTVYWIESVWCTGRWICSIANGTQWWFVRLTTNGGKRDTCDPQIIVEEAWWILTNRNGDILDYTQKSHFRTNGYCAWHKSIHNTLVAFCEE